MKGRVGLMTLLFAAGLLLAACSGGKSPEGGSLAVNSPGQENEHPPEMEYSNPDRAEDSGADSTEDENFLATPSPLFEQSYGSNQVSERDYSQYEIVTLLPEDGIPALSFPSYYQAEQADREYEPDEIVLGIEFNSDARAYPIDLLSRHEIVNDEVGGIKLAVTW